MNGAASARSTKLLRAFEPVRAARLIGIYRLRLGKVPARPGPAERGACFSFQERLTEQWLSLRYDLTAPLARFVAEIFPRAAAKALSGRYRWGWVFRNEKPGPGPLPPVQLQFDADIVGSPGVGGRCRRWPLIDGRLRWRPSAFKRWRLCDPG